MPVEVTTELLRLGLPGIVIAALAFAYWRKEAECRDLHAAALAREQKCRDELDAVQKERSEEQKQFREALVDLTRGGTAAITAHSAGVEAATEGVKELRNAVDRNTDEMRRGGGRGRGG